MSKIYDALIRQVTDVKKRLELTPTFRWATITSAEPLLVTLDGDHQPLPQKPLSLLPTLGAGRRVLALLINRRVILVGAAGGLNFAETAPPPNTIVINGASYPTSGSVAVEIGSWTYWTSPIAATTIQIPFPCDLPEGWTFQVYTLETNGFTIAQTAGIDKPQRRISVRVMQAFSNSTSALRRVGWRLVKQ